ncbi:MAG: HAMP domain-containing histidine kinase, partial [Defluviitaleaceae bacterium]|nr:HAMP domain-containing histidine kinase [Defluviitaleaceae bacterium]
MGKIRRLFVKMSGLRWKLFVCFLALSVLPLFFYAATALRTMDEVYTNEKMRDLLGYANRVATTLAAEGLMPDHFRVTRRFMLYVEEQVELTGSRIIVVDSSGLVVIDSYAPDMNYWAGIGITLLNPDIISALEGRSSFTETSSHMNVAVPIMSRDLTLHGSEPAVIGAVMVQDSMLDKNLLIQEMQRQLVLLTVFLAIIILILVFFISQLMIEPLKNLLSAVKQITDGRLDQRVKFYGNDEFAELGMSFNKMTERLAMVEQARSEFVSNVSHELKTPLSSIKVLGESLLLEEDVAPHIYREFLSDINNEVDRMTTIVNDLLALVLLDRTEQTLHTGSVKLNNLIEDIVRRLKPLAMRKNIGVYFTEESVVTVTGDEMKLSLALSNII